MGELSGYKAFIFDWDGTLRSVSIARKVNSMINPNWRRKKHEVHAEVHAPHPREISAGTKHVHTSSTLADLKEAEGELMALIADVSLRFIVPKLSYGAKQLLERLDSRGALVALYTDGALWRVYHELEYLRVTDYFDAVLSAQSLMRLKPDPLGLEVLLKALGTKKAEAVYVGDMRDDILAARNAGISSCAVTNGFDRPAALKAARPDYIYDSLEGLAREL